MRLPLGFSYPRCSHVSEPKSILFTRRVSVLGAAMADSWVMLNVDGLNDTQLVLLADMRLVFEDADWGRLDEILVSPVSDFRKTFLMETLVLQARNRFVRTHGVQPDNGHDDNLEDLFS